RYEKSPYHVVAKSSYRAHAVVDECIDYWRDIAGKCERPFRTELLESLKELAAESRNCDDADSDLDDFIRAEFAGDM
ncbi:MAG: hypothetical protein LUE27_04305, partial [Clostridia bacterium]|nr:hypothetical protein [Clostridia bacterium]